MHDARSILRTFCWESKSIDEVPRQSTGKLLLNPPLKVLVIGSMTLALLHSSPNRQRGKLLRPARQSPAKPLAIGRDFQAERSAVVVGRLRRAGGALNWALDHSLARRACVGRLITRWRVVLVWVSGRCPSLAGAARAY